MAFEEELEKRRAQREALRQKRLDENRRLITKLIIAGVVLVLCAVLIAVVVLRSPDQPDQTEPTGTSEPTVQTDPGTTEDTVPPVTDNTDPTETGDTTPTEPDPTAGTTEEPSTDPSTEPSEAPETNAPQEADSTVIHLTAAGDVNVNDVTTSLDYELAFRSILPLLCSGDLTVVNFEGNLIGAPYGTQTQSAPQELMTALHNAGVDLIQMANSRSIYNGLPGLKTTLSAIRAAGMEPVGAWATEEEAQEAGGYTIREVNGIKLAFVAFTKGMDSMALPVGSEDCVNVLYTDYATTYREVDTAGILEVLERVAEEEPDLTIALVHWGSEFRDQISSTQDTIRNLMLENGVDAIIGTHPHYVQALDFDRENGTFVAYSLGDLLSDGETAGTEYSIILDLEITKDHITGQTKITNYSYTSIFNVRREGQQLQLMGLDEAVAAYEAGHLLRPSQEMYEDMLYAQKRVEARVQPTE